MPWIREQLAPSIVGSTHHGFIVLSADGSTLYNDDGATLLVGASTQKLIVTVSALHLLGKHFVFRSDLITDPIASSVAPILWFVGSGDPLLTRQQLRAGVAQLARSGIRSVAGIGIDATAVSAPELNAKWNPNDDGEGFQAPTSGVSLDQDTVEVRILPSVLGEKARVTLHPAGSILRVIDGVRSTQSGTDIEVTKRAPNLYSFDGSIGAQDHARYWLPMHNVPKDVASVLRSMLHSAGISVGARVIIGHAPWTGTVRWEHRSAPLPQILRRMLLESNNHIAEQVLAAISRRVSGVGDDAHGLAYERSYLTRLGIATRGMVLVDGSGLSHSNRISMLALAQLLVRDRVALHHLLSGSGHGTLDDDDFGAASHRIRAKTGHLDGVSALVGYVQSQHHGLLIFAFAADGSSNDSDVAFAHTLDAIARW